MTLGELLNNLPSKGYFTSVQPGAAFGTAPASYIAAHDTAPPPGQVVKTDPASLLVKTLSKKPREEPKKAQARPADKGKRPAEDNGEGSCRDAKRHASRRGAPGVDGEGPSAAAAGDDAIPPPSESRYTAAALLSETVAKLKPILKAWRLPVSGRKEELVARIVAHQDLRQGLAPRPRG